MFRVACYDTNPHDARELVLSRKAFKSLDEAREYARTIASSREPRVLHELPLKPQRCACGGDSSDPNGWHSSCCGCC